MRRRWILLACIPPIAGCGSYSTFTLPDPVGRRSPVSLRWVVEPRPVLEPEPGSWDAVDVLNPAVVNRGGAYFNFYSGFDGKTWHTGLATSADGRHWTRRGKVLSPSGWEGASIAANGAALLVGGEFLYWYQAGDPPRVALARSPDGSKWTRHDAPVVGCGPRGSFDERGAADPYVIRGGAHFFMYYLGQDRARRQRIGLARSTDGVHWEKLKTSPVLGLGEAGAFDENGVGEPAVWTSHGSWWMLYTGRDRAEHRRIGVARSRDGVRWDRIGPAAVFSGTEAWNSKVVCDPEVEATEAGMRVWFGGGDVAHPAENIHGRIGLATLHIEAR